MDTSVPQDKKEGVSANEERIRKITQMYYSRSEIQKVIFQFANTREVVPRFFEGFGKRPDSLQYFSDILELVRRGATSLHCSEERWNTPLDIVTGMSKEQLNSIREGWDLLIDIDCKWFEYSKLAARAIVETLQHNGVKHIGIKFSGSKGFHILVPWEAFPKEVGNIATKDLFPELPRKIVAYIKQDAEKIMHEMLPPDFYEQFKNVKISKGIKCKNCSEIVKKFTETTFFCILCKREETKKFEQGFEKIDYKCPDCNRPLKIKSEKQFFYCPSCKISSQKDPTNFSETEEIDLFELMGLDLVLVSPRHLFRMPYSLHEKTALVSTVISAGDIKDFQPPHANPLTIKIQSFLPQAEKDEARELVMRTLDWHKSQEKSESLLPNNIINIKSDFKPLEFAKVTEEYYPFTIKKILEGMQDGKKRSLFILINFFRSLGMPPEQIEKKLKEWNEKNTPPLKEGYLKIQLVWAYRNKLMLPPNFSNGMYKDLGILDPRDEQYAKNPVHFVSKRISRQNWINEQNAPKMKKQKVPKTPKPRKKVTKKENIEITINKENTEK